ncbi:MAG: GNAT family N-acetyltransferase [Alphaproteobacteria bacterium]
MLDKLNLPEIVETKDCVAVRRIHKYNKEMFEAVDKNRNFLREYLFWVDGTNALEDVEKTTDFFISQWDEGINYAYIITDKNDKLLGMIDLHAVDYKNRNAEFGYWLSQNVNGKGYISQILQALEKLAFEQGLVRIYIRCDVANTSSNNVCIRNGYEFEGCMKKLLNTYGEFHDCNIYAKTI